MTSENKGINRAPAANREESIAIINRGSSFFHFLVLREVHNDEATEGEMFHPQ